MRNYGKEKNKCKTKQQKRKENGVGLATLSVTHKVQHKDMHWTGTSRYKEER
jgi:hypothetical protein